MASSQHMPAAAVHLIMPHSVLWTSLCSAQSTWLRQLKPSVLAMLPVSYVTQKTAAQPVDGLTRCAHLVPVQVKHDDLKEAAQHYVEELVAGKEFIADQKGSQLDALSTGIRSVNEELASSLASLQQGEFVDPEAPPAEVVNDLEQLQARLQALKVGRNFHIHTYMCVCVWMAVELCAGE